MKNDLINIGTITKFGKVEAIGFISGERYYWIIDTHGTISMMPHSAISNQQPNSNSKDG